MKYNIVASLSIKSMGHALGELELDVNNYIAKGWKPVGNVSMFKEGIQFYAAQAMIKEDEEYEQEGQIYNQRTVSVH